MKNESSLSSTIWSGVLLFTVFFTVFIVALFPVPWHKYLYKAGFTVIYISAIMNLDKHRREVIFFTVLVFVANWTSGFWDLEIVSAISKILNMAFFLYVVGALIKQIARSKTVNSRVIAESILGYLLIGIVYAILVALSGQLDANGYNFHAGGKGGALIAANFSQDLYYTFITMATVGYGDMLPTRPYTQSLATLIGITGQLYIGIIIAMLVGKFLSQKTE